MLGTALGLGFHPFLGKFKVLTRAAGSMAVMTFLDLLFPGSLRLLLPCFLLRVAQADRHILRVLESATERNYVGVGRHSSPPLSFSRVLLCEPLDVPVLS